MRNRPAIVCSSRRTDVRATRGSLWLFLCQRGLSVSTTVWADWTKSVREKEISDGQDTQNTGGRESDRAIEYDDLAASAEWRVPRAGEAWESRHPLDWLAAERD